MRRDKTETKPSVDKGNPYSPLSPDDVKNIITLTQAGVTDPMTFAIQIFENLGCNVTLSGEILRQALTDAEISADGPLGALVAAAQNITKNGNEVRVAMHE